VKKKNQNKIENISVQKCSWADLKNDKKQQSIYQDGAFLIAKMYKNYVKK